MSTKVTINYKEEEGIDFCGKFYVRDEVLYHIVSAGNDKYVLVTLCGGYRYENRTSMSELQKIIAGKGFTQIPSGTEIKIEVG